MDQKYRAILERNRQILVSNIIPSDEFLDQLLKEKVLPMGMIRDVKEGQTREDKNNRLLNALQLRASHAYRRFRNVLLDTGHCFLADLLWDDETNNSNLSEGLFTKFPTIFERIPQDVKKRFLQYLDCKVRVKSLQFSWVNSSSRRIESLYARSEDIRQEGQLRTTIDDLQKKVRALEQEIKSKDGKIMYLSIEAKSLEKQLQQTRQEHKQELEKQRNFNLANNSTVVRLRERLAMFNGDIVRMNEMIREVIDDTPCSHDSDPDHVKVSTLKNNLSEVLRNIRDRENTVAVDERKKILHLLWQGGPYDDTDNILEVVRTHVEREAKQRVRFVKEVEKMQDSLKGKPASGRHQSVTDGISLDNRYVTNMLATIRVEVEHLNKKLAWKDSEITKLTTELEALSRNGATSQEPSLTQDQNWDRCFEMPDHPEVNGEKSVNIDEHLQQQQQQQQQIRYNSNDTLMNVRNSRPQRLKGQQLGKRNRQNVPLSKAKSFDYRNSSMMNMDSR
ncbi:A-kinase anchor protein 9-like [Gigantopelta aegis]|uniref:A-kinase anchor protein 9-like n=1 Tax=Gigantopelta aegis TaxID=1735272 RepID=UPI001B88C38F|nr:A-kinase anchor protein 9-like [Gigantopelta aegis]XP_041349737.1 A-kinase anchor protein 9-like [Gigantopelta aegis]XP_041349739.1 A-kinase anchor protein 9-like [Gigantopelta aegis]